MATNNFTADGGEWNTSGNWSLGHVPTNTEDCTFTGVTSSGRTITITTTAAACKSLDFSGVGSGLTLACGSLMTCSGNVTMDANMIVTASGGYFNINGNCTFIQNGANLSAAALRVFNNATLTLGSNLSCGGLNLSAFGSGGILSTSASNYTVTAATGSGIFGSAGNMTLTLGSSTINVTNVAFTGGTLTVTSNTATVTITATADTTTNLGGVNWNGTSFVCVVTGGKILTLNGANTVDKFKISWTTDNILSALVLGADQVFENATANAFELIGADTVTRPMVQSSVIGTPRHIHANTVNITKACDWRDIHFDPHTVDLSAIASGNCGGNEGITFRTPADYYLDFGTANAAMVDNCWATSSGGGAGGTGVFPLPQDTIVLDNSSWDDTGNTFTVTTNHRVGNIYTADLTEAQTIVFGAASNVFGDLILTGSNLTVTTTSATLTLNPRLKNEGSDTLDINCLPSAGSGSFVVGAYEGQVGTVRLVTNNLTHTGTFTLSYGIFDLNGLTLSTNVFSSSSSNTRTLQSSASGGKIITTGGTGTIFNMGTDTNLTVKKTGD